MKRKRFLSFLLSLSLIITPSFGAVEAYGEETETIEVPADIVSQSAETNAVDLDENIVSETQSDNEGTQGAGLIHIDKERDYDVVSQTVMDDDETLSAEGSGVNLLGASPTDPSYSAIADNILPDTFFNQGVYNTCWALSSLTACYINAKKKGINVDELSPSHLAYYFYGLSEDVADPLGNQKGDNARTVDTSLNFLDAGGNAQLAMWELASWMGPVDGEDDLKYENVSPGLTLLQETSSVYGCDSLHVQGAYITETDAAHRSDIKKMISEFGAVVSGYYTNDTYANFHDEDTSHYGNYYCNDLGTNKPNHQITIIGWDDNYKKEWFKTAPTSDGAWLVLNSWGDEDTVKPERGYFWLSYEDKGILSENTAISFDVEASTNHDNIYQYDGSFGIRSKDVDKVVQVFETGDSEQILEAASIGVDAANVPYEASVYLMSDTVTNYELINPNENNWLYNIINGSADVQNGDGEAMTFTELDSQSGTFSFAGYHTVSFANSGVIPANSKLAVVFEFENTAPVFTDEGYTLGGFWKFNTGTDKHRTLTFDAASDKWTVFDNGKTARIKMFTYGDTDSQPTITAINKYVTIELSDESEIIDYIISGVSDELLYDVEFESDDQSVVFVDDDGRLLPNSVGGPVTIDVNLLKDDNVVATDYVYVTVVADSVSSIKLNKNSASLPLHGEETLSYTIKPSNAVAGTATWTSNMPSVATVSNSGKVTAVGYGTATITCTVDGKSDTCEVTVGTTYTGIELDTDSVRLKKGSNTQLIATILPEDTPDEPEITWTSSKPSVATVSSDGKVTAVGYGTATITATAGDYSDTCSVEVFGQMTGIEIDRTSAAIKKGGSITLEANALPSGTTDPVSFTWSSDRPSVATVDQNGKVTGVDNGTAVITVTCGGYSKTCTITVTGALTGIAVTPEKMTMVPGQTQTLRYSLEPAGLVDNVNINLASSNGNIATVDANGVVTAKAVGNCTITATAVAGGKTFSKSCTITVDTFSIKQGNSTVSSITLEKDKSTTLTAKNDLSGTDASVKWTSSMPSVATVDSTGKVTAKSKGSARITASSTSGSYSKSVAVTVTDESSGSGGGNDPVEPPKPAVSITNQSEVANMSVGQTKTISVSVTPKTGITNITKSYSSTDKLVADVSSDGKITAKKEGTATITVTVNSDQGKASKSFTVTVSKAGSSSGGSSDPADIVDGTYALVIDNLSDVKNVVIGEDMKIELSVTAKNADGEVVTVSANDVGGDITFEYDADGEYVDVDADGNVFGLKGGSGRLTVIANVGNNTVLRKTFYVNVKAGSGGSYTTSKEKDDEGNDPTVSNNAVGQESEKEKERKAKVNKAEPVPVDTNVYSKKIVMSGAGGRHEVSPDGGTLQLKAVVSPSNTTNSQIKWSSSNQKYASVDKNGLVTGKKAGAGKSVVITTEVTDGSGVKASYFVKIAPHYIKSLKLATEKKVKKKVKKNGKVVKKNGKPVYKETTKNVYKKRKVTGGSSIQIKTVMELTGKDAIKKLNWSSSNTDWAVVDKNGKVKTYKEGIGHSVIITAELIDHSKKATYEIQIIKPYVKKITLSEKKKTDKDKKKAKKIKTIKGVAGKKLPLQAKVQTVGKPVDKTLTWVSSNTKWATVNKKGKVSLKKKGAGHTVRITAYSADGKKKGEIKIKIYKTQEEKEKAEKEEAEKKANK